MLPHGNLPFGDSRNFRIGKYELLAHLATGGMGSVFRARDTQLQRDVALKVLQVSLANRDDVIERFRREARHCARLRHEGIVTIYDYGEDGGYLFLAMELVEGTNLYDYMVRNGPLSAELALKMMGQVAKALEHAHSEGIIHRDIKPSNILIINVNTKPKAKLIDFGLALLAAEDEFRVTRDGSTVGTVDYMPPEQAQDSRAVDIRSDIYSLGCTFYHLLAGRPPFPEGGIAERLQRHAEEEPIDIREFQPQVPRWLARVIARMLAKKPEHRFQNPTELLDALRRKKSPTELQKEAKEEARSDVESDAPTVITSTREDEPESKPESKPEPEPTPEPEPKKSDFPQGPSSSGSPFTPTEIHQVAEKQFGRAAEILTEGQRDPSYPLGLLLDCCKQDSKVLRYRQTLRRVQETLQPNTWKVRWLGWLKTTRTRWKLKSAFRAKQHEKVLLLGEEILTVNPYDVKVHLTMADSAMSLGYSDVGFWILEHGRHLEDVRIFRSLAEYREKRGEYPAAIAAWKDVRRLAPNNFEAEGKIKDLTANETIARGRYEEQLTQRFFPED